MGLFDFFKKKDTKEEYTRPDFTDLFVTDLETGYVLNYDLKTWVVVEHIEYDWGDEQFSQEFKIDNGEEVATLFVEEADDVAISIVRDDNSAELLPAWIELFKQVGTPQQELTYNGTTFKYSSESAAYCRNITTQPEVWRELMLYTYLDSTNRYCISIEQWNDNDFDISCSKQIADYEISSIYPSKRD